MMKTITYKITEDALFMDEQNAMTPELKKKLQGLYNLSLKGNKKDIPEFLALIEKYPRNPQIKNYLSALYSHAGMHEKAEEMNQWILAEHPNYLFAKLNYAQKYLSSKQYEKIPEILGENMELQALYPERDTFHLVELIAFLRISIQYFGAIQDWEQAEIRLEILEELDPDSEGTKQANKIYHNDIMQSAAVRYKREEKEKIITKPVVKKVKQTTEIPQFNHPEVIILYSKDFEIEDGILEQILALPRITLIEDLEKIIIDSIYRYDYHSTKSTSTSFCIHALCLLGELKAEESLSIILFFLSQEEEVIEFYLNDFMTEYGWQIIYQVGQNQLEVLKNFMLEEGVYTYSKSEVSVAVKQIALEQLDRRNEVINWFELVLASYSKASFDDNIVDSDLIGLIIGNVIDIRATKLLFLIKELFDKGYVSVGINGNYKDVEKYIKKAPSSNKEKVQPTHEIYKQILEHWGGFEDEEDADEFERLFEKGKSIEDDYQPIRVEPKIGRNDPCPCGSGKKYKKCCAY